MLYSMFICYQLPDAINCQFRKFAAALLCIFCRRTNSLEFTAWSFAQSSTYR